MRIGDLVRLAAEWGGFGWETSDVGAGIIIDFKGSDPVVYWNEKFPEEIEYASQLRIVTPRKKELV